MYLHHMTHEETVTTTHFHRYCTDEEIIDAGRRLIAALGPQEATRAMRRMIPSMDAVDRLEYMRVVLASVPDAVAPAVMALAAETLAGEEYGQLVAALDGVAA